MYFLTYVSSATHAFTADSLAELLAVAERNNRRDSITGMLLYRRGNFMQFMEGEEASVTAAYLRISVDPRHSGLIVLMQGSERARQFPDWCMGFNDLDSNTPKPERFEPFKNSSLSAAEFSPAPSRAQELLLMFRGR